MVPSKKGRRDAARENNKSKGSGRKATGKGQAARTTPPILIDPDLAVVIKSPVRVQIVAVAHQRAISPVEFAEEHGHGLTFVAEQFKALVNADFLELVEEVKVRGTVKHLYRATRRAFVSGADWGALGKSIQAGMSGAIVQDFNGRIADAMEAGTLDSRDDRCLFWLGLTLDEISWPKFVGVLAWAISEVKDLEVETAKRQAAGEGKGSIPTTFAIAGFESPRESERRGMRRPQRKRHAPSKKRT